MSVRRTIKKTVYACIYVLLFGGFCTLVILPFLPEKPPVVAPVVKQTFLPITIENIVVLPHLVNPGPFGKTIDVVARLKNENVRSGTGKYPVVLLVKDPSGATIGRVEQIAYVLPAGVQYIAFIDVPVPSSKEFGTVEILPPSDVSLEQIADSARVPEFGVFLRERTSVAVGSQNIERQTGIVTNNSTFDWEKVEVTGVALDEKGNIVGIGKTFVGKLVVDEQREFTVAWPVPLAPTSRVIAIATTNIYSAENKVHIIGDPNALR